MKFGVGGWVPGSGSWVLSKRDCRGALDHANGVTPRNDKRSELILISPSVPVFAFSYAVASCVLRSVYCVLCFKTLVTSHQTLLFGIWALEFEVWSSCIEY